MQTIKILLSFVIFTIYSTYLLSQTSESSVPSAPTSFQTSINPEEETQLSESLRKSPSVQVNANGGFGQFSTLSIRGSDSNDIGVGFEGIRLNSPAQGSFDLSKISLFGIENVQVVRGAYSPFSTHPSGFVNIQLPDTEQVEAQMSWGSFDYYSLGVLSPNASFSFEQAENDFLFSRGNSFLRRFQNRSRKMNLLAWHKLQDHQFWGILNVVSRELPPPANNLTAQYEDYFQGVSPMLAYQGRHGSWQWSGWVKFEEQEVSYPTDTQSNRIWYSGASVEKTQNPTSKISLRHGLEFTQDYLFHADFDAKNRHTVSIFSSAYLSPHPRHFIHPRIRVEFVTDLGQPFSVHPGLGGRHQLTKDLSALWNLSYISRAPTFSELYYDLGTFVSNPDLDREQSLHGDLGYEWKIGSLYWQQAFFANRTFDSIVISEISPDQYQSINSGTEVSWGLEHELRYSLMSSFEMSAAYTYLRAMLHKDQKPYQARHQLNLQPRIIPNDVLEFSLPVYARSSVRIAENSDSKISPQWNVGAKMLAHWARWQLSLEALNLLRWELEEIANYPLPQETYYRITASYQF